MGSSPRPSAPATSRHSSPPSDQVLDPALLLVPPLLPEAQLPPPLRRRRRRRKKSQPRNPTTTWDSASSTKLQPFSHWSCCFIVHIASTRCLTLSSGYSRCEQ